MLNLGQVDHEHIYEGSNAKLISDKDDEKSR